MHSRWLLYCSLLLLLFLPHLVKGQGGWVRDTGSVYARCAFTTLSTTRYYDQRGDTSTIPRLGITTANLYVEYGFVQDVMLIADAQLLRRTSIDGVGDALGFGDIVLGARYALVKDAWPISVGVALDLPTGNPAAQIVNKRGDSLAAPSGDGEMSLRIMAGLSHSFWPINGFISVDAGYDLRGVVVRDAVANSGDGTVRDQVRLSVKAGYQPVEALWLTLTAMRLQAVGPEVAGRYSVLGMGDGVEWTAWTAGASWNVTSSLSLSLEYSTALPTPRSIFGGANIIFGVAFSR